jgi:hypothetical protein
MGTAGLPRSPSKARRGGALRVVSALAIAAGALPTLAAGSASAPGAPPPPLPTLTIPCTDSAGDVYVTPAGLPPWGPGVLGDVVRCSVGTTISAVEMETRLVAAGVEGVTPISGATTYLLAYRTTRRDGVEGVGTARLYLPDTLHPEAPLPVVVSTHGTVGLADHCAPSKDESISDYIVLPFVGQGFVVIAPDYAGLGNEGVQGYRQKRDTGHSALDAARAAREAVLGAALAPGTIVSGHSQGGGAALSAQAFGASYGDDDVLGVVAFAPGWSYDTEGLRLLVRFPGFILYSLANAPFPTLELYADAANYLGAGQEVDYFHPDVRAGVFAAIGSDCIVALHFSLPPLGTTFADVLDPDFVSTADDCFQQEAGCGPPGEEVVDRAAANIVSADSSGGPILVLQGMEDTVATPASTACIVEKLTDDGATPQVCTLADAEHSDIVGRTIAFAADWAFALAAGDSLPTCDPHDLPDCGDLVFADGFESADTTAWSTTVGGV